MFTVGSPFAVLHLLLTVYMYLDVVSHNRDILEVESSVNLVHNVEGRWFVVMEGKDQGQGAECLLSARQIGDVLPAFLWRSHAEDYAFREWVEAVD